MAIPERQYESVIDSDYLMAGRKQALADGIGERDHPVTAEQIVAMKGHQKRYAENNLTRHWAHIVEAWLWFVGQHHLRVDDASRRFVRIDSLSKIPRPVVNLVLEKTESVAGDLSKGVVVGRVRPNSNHIHDVLGSRAADDIRRFTWDEQNMDDLQRNLIQGTCVAGDMFTIAEIDQDHLKRVKVELPRQDGSHATIELSLPDACTRSLSPLQVFGNPSATGVDQNHSRWIHVLVDHSIDAIKAQYPHVKDEVADDSGSDTVAQWQRRLREMMTHEAASHGFGSVFNRGSGWDLDIEKPTTVHQIMFHPDRYYPRGRMFIVAGNAVCYAGELPLGEVMMDQYRYSPVDGSFYSLGLVQPLISLNRYIESAIAQNTLSRKMSAMPIWLVPSRAGGRMWEGELKMHPGMIAKYRSNAQKEKPELIQGRHPADAGYVADMQMFIQEFFERVSGAKQVLTGERPEGISAGIALRQLIQRASIRFAPKLSALLRFIESMESHRLEALSQSPRWQLPIPVILPGRAGRRAWKMARAADMKDNYSYRIEAEAKSLTDEVALAQTTLDAVQMGVINIMDPMVGPRNRQKVLERIGLGDAGFEDDGSPDRNYAARVYAKMLDGEDYALRPFDNVQVLFAEFLNFIKEPEFDEVPDEIASNVMNFIGELQQRVRAKQLGSMFREADVDQMAEDVAGGEPEAPPVDMSGAGPMGAAGSPGASPPPSPSSGPGSAPAAGPRQPPGMAERMTGGLPTGRPEQPQRRQLTGMQGAA